MSGHQIKRDMRNDTLCIEVAGALDAETVFHLNATVQGGLPAAKEIIVNLAETDFMDSAGLGFFTQLKKRAEKENLVISITGVQGQPARLFSQIGGVHNLEVGPGEE